MKYPPEYYPEGFVKPDGELLEFFNGGFRVGQSYEDEPCKQARCKVCGTTQFEVGAGSYFTALRCPACGWEVCFHEG